MEMHISMGESTKAEKCRNPSSSDTSIINGSLRHHIVTRSDQFPTTFVQADTSSFKHIVQMLTSVDSPPPPPPSATAGKGSFVIPAIKTMPAKKQTGFKLYERRNNGDTNKLIISTLMTGGRRGLMCRNGSHGFSPRSSEILSPSCLDFPKLGLNSPVTPLKNCTDGDDPFDKMSSPLSEEEKAIAGKGFYLHPSPVSTPRNSHPLLLPLFPVTSPGVSPEETN